MPFRVATAVAGQPSAKLVACSHDDDAHRPDAFLRRLRMGLPTPLRGPSVIRREADGHPMSRTSFGCLLDRGRQVEVGGIGEELLPVTQHQSPQGCRNISWLPGSLMRFLRCRLLKKSRSITLFLNSPKATDTGLLGMLRCESDIP